MSNIDLNIGGLIGALAVGGLAAAVIFTSVDLTHSGRGPYKLIIFALIGGALAGNFLWQKLFKKPQE
jgi:hypothetical protein